MYKRRCHLPECYNFLRALLNTFNVDEQVKSDSLSISHKESSASSAQLEYTETGQLDPANGARVRALWQPQYTTEPYSTDEAQFDNSWERTDKYAAQVLMDQEMRTNLQWWEMIELWILGTPVCIPSCPELVLESDVSQKKWGARCMETSTRGSWSGTET